MGRHPEAPFHFVDNVASATATAEELAGERTVEVSAGDVAGQMLAAGLVRRGGHGRPARRVRFRERYFGSVDAQHLLEDPDVVIQGDGVLHLRFRVRRDR